MEVSVVDFNDTSLSDRYDRLFEACPSAYIQQSALWCNAIRELGPDEPYFLLCSYRGEDIAGLPLYLFRSDAGSILTSVPQPGPQGGIFFKERLSKSVKRETYKRLINVAMELAHQNNCLTITLITNPISDDIELYQQLLNPDYTFENFTQIITLSDLYKDRELILPDLENKHYLQRNLRKANKLEYFIEECNTLEDFESWYEIHIRRFNEIQAKPLNKQLLYNIYSTLAPKSKSRLLLIKSGEEITTGCLYVYHKNVFDVYMICLDSKYAQFGVNFVLTEYSIKMALELGAKYYNWQSSQRKGCGVYQFKQQWGSIDYTYYIVTKIIQGIEPVKTLGLQGLQKYFPWHYVVPFGVFSKGFDQTYFIKG